MEQNEMIMAYAKLYNKIVHSNDDKAMHILGRTIKAMVEELISCKPETAHEYLETLEAVNWNNYLTKKEACRIVKEMQPKKGWDISDWEKEIESLELNDNDDPYYNKWALYTTMNMIYSDSATTILKIMRCPSEENQEENLFKAIYYLSLDKLKDEDGVFNIRSYFNL